MISSTELASLCGVSQGTVDRALHNRAGVSAKTREKILAVAEEHGYRPNLVASELIQGESTIVGVILPSLRAAFFTDVVQAIQDRLRQDGLRVHVAVAASAQEEQEAVADFAGRRCRAVLLVPPQSSAAALTQVAKGHTVIALINKLQARGVQSIVPDERSTGVDAVAYLYSMGHRNIMHLTYVHTSWAVQERLTGYEHGMKSHNLLPHVQHVDLAVLDNASQMLEDCVRYDGVTAFFCHNDWLALCTIRVLQAAGIRVPEDVSIMGVDGQAYFADLYPDMCTMAYPRLAVAENVARCIQGKRAVAGKPRCTIMSGSSVQNIQ